VIRIAGRDEDAALLVGNGAGGGQVLEITVGGYDAVDPLNPAETPSGLGITAYYQAQQTPMLRASTPVRRPLSGPGGTLPPRDHAAEGSEARRMNGAEIPKGVEIEQVWAIEADFAPDGEARRQPVRHAHLAQLMREGVVVVAGAVGHLESAFIVVRVADEAAAREFAEHDVHGTSGAWARIRVRPYGLVRLSDA
jgi:uncharacterized protein YciI